MKSQTIAEDILVQNTETSNRIALAQELSVKRVLRSPYLIDWYFVDDSILTMSGESFTAGEG